MTNWHSSSRVPDHARFRVPGYSPTTLFERDGNRAVPVNDDGPSRDIHVLASAYAAQGGLVPEPGTDTMTVKVFDRAAQARRWGRGGGEPIVRTVTISAYCPRCGQRRGEPSGHNVCEDGEYFHINQWKNPCGHIDYYAAVITEADWLAEQSKAVPAS